MFKIGQKLKCKREYVSVITGMSIFEKDVYYPITEVNKNLNYVRISKNNGEYKTVFGYGEYEGSTDFVYNMLYDYFYTVGEVRKERITSILKDI